MFIALREMRRAAVRFSLLVVAIGMLMFLILFQQALQKGLITGFVGAVQHQSAPVLVYSVDAQRTLQASIITPDLAEKIRQVDGVGSTASVVQGTFTVRVDGGAETDASIIGTDDRRLVHPTTLSAGRSPRSAGEAVGSENDFIVGSKVEAVPAPVAKPVVVRVVGLARDIQLNVTPTLFTDVETSQRLYRAVNPTATGVLPNAIAVEPASGVSPDQIARKINDKIANADALTRVDLADKSPGVAQVRQSFQVIFLLYGLVVPLVTGLFFLIVTLQKLDALVLLRAVGVRTSSLVRALLIEVLVVIGLGLALGIALFAPLSRAQVGGLALRFDPKLVLEWTVLLLGLGALSAVASVRRVTRIDPIRATTGGGVQ